MSGLGNGSPTRGELAEQLVAARIAGPVATPREGNLANYRLMSARDPGYLFGLAPRGAWSYEDVLALMAARCGVSPDPGYDAGDDSIDPQLTIERLDALAEHLRMAAAARARVLLATGHPTGVFAVHLALARALEERGCTLLGPPASWVDSAGAGRARTRHIRHLRGVAVACQGAGLVHTHSPEPMRLMLGALAAAGEPPPDLVVADHGFAGAAGAAGVTSAGFADSNDPALFVGEAEGDIAVAVPLDDNVDPRLYDTLISYLLAAAFG